MCDYKPDMLSYCFPIFNKIIFVVKPRGTKKMTENGLFTMGISGPDNF